MPITKEAIRNKLGSCSIDELEDRHKEKIYRCLEDIVRGSEKAGFSTSSSLQNLKGIGDRFVFAAIDYLEENGYIRIGKKLPRTPWKIVPTNEGRDAWLTLDGLLNPPKIENISFSLNFGDKDCKLQIDLKNQDLTSFGRIATLLKPELLEGLLRAIQEILLSSLLNNFTLSIKSQLPYVFESSIMETVYHMVKYFEGRKLVVMKRIAPEDFREGYSKPSLEHLNDEGLYSKYFERVLDLKIADMKKEELTELLRLPDRLLHLIEQPEVKSWITERLKQNPNFFLPHSCWEKLGFEIRKKKTYEENEVTPPSIMALLNYPSLKTKLLELIEIFERTLGRRRAPIGKAEREVAKKLRQFERKVMRVKWTNNQKAYGYLHLVMPSYDTDPEFYECWSILRQDPGYRGAIPDLYKVFDSAHGKYILKGRKPAVDLARVFADLANNRVDLSGALEKIMKGEYRIEPDKERHRDPMVEKICTI